MGCNVHDIMFPCPQPCLPVVLAFPSCLFVAEVPGAPVLSATFSAATSPPPQLLCAVSCREGTYSITFRCSSPAPLLPPVNCIGALSRRFWRQRQGFSAAWSDCKTTLQTPVVDCAPTTETPTPLLLLRHQWRNTRTQTGTHPKEKSH